MTGMLLALAGAGMSADGAGSAFARLSPAVVEGVILGVGVCTTDEMRVIAAGAGPFTYAWSIIEGDDGWTIGDDDGAETRFAFTLPIHGHFETASVQVVVTNTSTAAACTLVGTATARSTSTA